MKLPDIEAVAAKVHEAWMQSKLAQGVTSRKSEAGEELMVPSERLSEAAKELDRGSVRAVFAVIKALTKADTRSTIRHSLRVKMVRSCAYVFATEGGHALRMDAYSFHHANNYLGKFFRLMRRKLGGDRNRQCGHSDPV